MINSVGPVTNSAFMSSPASTSCTAYVAISCPFDVGICIGDSAMRVEWIVGDSFTSVTDTMNDFVIDCKPSLLPRSVARIETVYSWVISKSSCMLVFTRS